MRRIINIFLVSAVSFNLVLAEPVKECVFVNSVDFNPVGDTRGASVLSKKEVVRDCNITDTIQGECIKWQENKDLDSLPAEAYSGFDNQDYEDSIGAFFAMAGAYDQMEHIWSGFRGHCVSGTLQDFDWVSDPMFWAGLVLDYLMAGGEAGSVSDGFNSGVESAGNLASDSTSEIFADQAGAVTWSIAGDMAEEAAMDAGKCMTSAGINMATATADFLGNSTGDSDKDCNPIDEICQVEDTTDQSDIMTMDAVQFDDMIQAFIDDGDDISDYIEVIDNGESTGVVAYRFKEASEVDGFSDMDTSAAEDLKKKIKNTKAAVSAVIIGASLASCMIGATSASVSQTNAHEDDNSRLSAETAANLAITQLSRLIPAPWGPVVGAALKVVMAIATSFKSIDSCHSEDDAATMGSRHEKTQKALEFNLCRPLYDKCEDEWALVGGCCLTGYEYCCYDQLLTKILVEQLKAELGRDWSNCTGISLRDLNYVSFRQCSDSEMNDGLDGAHQYGENWDPKDAFQYKHKCMDMTEFKDYLKDVIGEDISDDVFDDYWNDLMDKDPV